MANDDEAVFISPNEVKKARGPGRRSSKGSVSSVSEATTSKTPLDGLSTKTPKELADALKDKGNKHYADGLFHEAITTYSEAIDRYVCPTYYYNRSQCYFKLGNLSVALEDAKQAVELNPTYSKAHARVLRCLILMGRAEESRRHYDFLSHSVKESKEVTSEVEFGKTFEKLKEDIEKYSTREEWRSVAYYCQRLLEQVPTLTAYKIKRAEALVLNKRVLEAVDIVMDVLRLDNRNVDAIFVRGLIFFYQGNVDKAVDTFKHAVQLAPDHSKSITYLKKIKCIKKNKDEAGELLKQEKVSDALEIYQKTIQIEPCNDLINSKLYFNVSICYAKLKKNSEALTAVNEAIKLDGNYFKAKLKQVHLLIENEKYDDAVREAESLYRTNKDQSVRALLDKAKTELKRSKQKDYYKILGIARNATEDDIKKAYKKKALLHHPDRHSNATPEEKKEHETKFKELGEAYAILSDKNKKMRYDNGHDIEDILSGSAGRQTTADFGFDPNEIFASFFGGGANFAHPFNFNPHGGGGGTFQSQNHYFGSGRNNPFGF